MPTLFAVYNLKADQKTEEYDNYLVNTKTRAVNNFRAGDIIIHYHIPWHMTPLVQGAA